jgi:hypothetical protein
MLFRDTHLVRGFRFRDDNPVTISELRGKERYVLVLRLLRDEDTVHGKEPGDQLAVATLEVSDLEICKLLAAGADAATVREQGLEVLRMLGRFAKRGLRLLLWRTGSTEPSDPIRLALSFSWSESGENWKRLDSGISLNLTVEPVFGFVTQPLADEVSVALAADLSEPLGHELLREAWQHRDTAPRSALVIGMAAAEVAFKSYAGALAPKAKWLIDELQAPPLDKMLKDFLPLLDLKLRINGKALIPTKLRRTLKRGVELRNMTAHSSAQEKVKWREVREVLAGVRDLLYLLDVYCGGQRWAVDMISHDSREFFRADQERTV